MSERKNSQDAAIWSRLADLDLRAGEKALGGDDPLPSDACFHAQQAGEKYLKAYLVSRGIHPPRTHDLEVLLKECANLDPAFRALHVAAEVLTPFAVGPRYPLGEPEYTIGDARQALDLARMIGEFVRSKIA